MSYLKLIWDFKGPSSEKIAEHHETHLKEFFILENKKLNIRTDIFNFYNAK